MAKDKDIIKTIIDEAARETGVEVCRAPAASAGEKIIYRYSPGKYDGDFEEFSVTMRFISKDMSVALERAKKVSRAICLPGDKSYYDEDSIPVYIVREDSGGSGYIGRTGHFFVLTKFCVRRRLESSVETWMGTFI